MISNKEISVLLFHRICDNSDLLWPSMPVKSFERLIYKINKTTEITSFKDLLSIKAYPSKPMVILSFDDGYVDFIENVMPIFKSMNIKANHNICPGLIDLDTPPWTQILSLYLSFKNSENKEFNSALNINNGETFNEKKFIELCKLLLQYDDNKRNDLISPLLQHIPKEKVFRGFDLCTRYDI